MKEQQQVEFKRTSTDSADVEKYAVRMKDGVILCMIQSEKHQSSSYVQEGEETVSQSHVLLSVSEPHATCKCNSKGAKEVI